MLIGEESNAVFESRFLAGMLFCYGELLCLLESTLKLLVLLQTLSNVNEADSSTKLLVRGVDKKKSITLKERVEAMAELHYIYTKNLNDKLKTN